MVNLIKEQIKFKINDIDKLFSEYELIFEKIKGEKPDLFDITILGSVLHSFYNGIENIFEIIAKNIDGNVPAGNKSHQELLHQMASENEKRNEIINEKKYNIEVYSGSLNDGYKRPKLIKKYYLTLKIINPLNSLFRCHICP